MGQKVHPLGFRIGITKKHQAQWFAPFRKYKYSQTIVEDCFLRDTLTNLFPQLINPTEQKKSKRDDGNQNAAQTPRISMIRIERGLIPYEIGIQVHAENCELLKSSIENLKVKQELVANVEKSRYFLNTLKAKIEPQQDMEIAVSPSRKKQTNAAGFNKMGSKKRRTKKQAATILFSKLRAKKLYAQGVNIQTNELRATNRLAGTALKTKKALIELYTRRSQKAVLGNARDGKSFRTQRPTLNRNLQTFKTLNSLLFEKSRITRRLRKRLTIRKRILARLFRGIIFQQKGNIVTRQYLKPLSSMRKKAMRNRRASGRKGQIQRFVNKTTTTKLTKLTRRPNQPVKPTLGKKKFLSVLSAKLDQNFLKQLKQQLTVCHQEMAQHRQEDRKSVV